ncbi:MAG: DUF4445 domain-containing protein [Desulfobacterales bacterium]|nr:MAG: DUF4445 domain-containing protein [Desulfobacterales bacterium]
MKKTKKPKKKARYKGPPPVKTKKSKFLWLNVLPQDMWLKVKRGSTLWEALRETDVNLEGECGGLGKCGKCRIRVVTAIGPPSREATELLSPEELKTGTRLACRTKIRKNLVIHTEVSDDEVEFFQILKYGQMPIIQMDPLLDKRLVSVQPPSLENPASDVDRIREALGQEYRHLKVGYRCLSSLYKDLRKTKFEGAAVLHDECLLAWQPRKMAARRYGLIFDIGTSTLVGALVSLLDGQDVAVVSRLNSQNRHGSDVISRIQYVKEHPKGLSQMRRHLVEDLNILSRRLLQVAHLAKEDIAVAVLAGNTTMQHLLLGLDPRGIAEAPFAPVITEGMIVKAHDVGVDLHPEAILYIMPSKSGYIGGDLLGFVLASGAANEKDRLVLGLDFGTNGEIFLGNRERILTCSAAAGPALEGARITHGMIGKAGAIESFRCEGNRLRYQVIGNIEPKGLCGSGLVDLVALLLHHDLLDADGLLRPINKEAANEMASRLVKRAGNELHDFIVVPAADSSDGREIRLTQNDIRELQLAKGAIAAGVKTLMKTIGVDTKDIDVVYLAGALGNYVNPLSAMRIGLIPRIDPEKIVPLGNAASTGAKMVLLSRQYWDKSAEIARFVEHIELSTHPNLFEYFVQEMSFPAENLW